MAETVKTVGEPFKLKSSAGNDYYMFEITFESGKKGKFSSIDEKQTKFVPGQTYEVTEEEVTSKAGFKYIKFNKATNSSHGKASKPFQSHYDKPDVVESISKTVSHQMAVKLLSKLDLDIQSHLKFKESRKKYASLIYNYFFKDHSNENSDAVNSNCNLKRRSSLDIAIESMSLPFETPHLSTFDSVLNYADEIYKDIA